MNIGYRGNVRVTTLLLLTALCSSFSGIANAQTAGDPANPETWRTSEYRAQWELDLINAAAAYAKGVDGSGVWWGSRVCNDEGNR